MLPSPPLPVYLGHEVAVAADPSKDARSLHRMFTETRVYGGS